MDIFEDDIFMPDDKKADTDEILSYLAEERIETENKKENISSLSSEVKKPSSGMRIIYQADEERGPKRVFTGFTDEKEEEIEEIIEEKIEEEEEEEIAEPAEESKSTYKGGYDFEKELLAESRMPSRRVVPRAQSELERKYSFEEEKRRRYIENLRREEDSRARAQRLREATEKKKAVYIIDSDIVEIKTENKKTKSTGDRVRTVVLVVAIIAMLASIGVLVKQYVQQRQVEDWENEVTGLLIDVEDTTKPNKKKKKNKEESTTERVLTIEEQWEKLYKDYPKVKFPQGLSLKYAQLYAVNQDFVGYLSIDEFGVGLPVVQSDKDTEDENYYLRKSFYKKYSVYGCPFVPKDNNMDSLDRNTVIYGHNNNSNIAFAPVNKYKTVDGYKSAPVIQFDTIYAMHKWKIVAAFIINTKADDDNGYIFKYNFTKMQDDAEFMNYIRFVKERSLYDTGVDILPSDKILTLSTCTHDFDDARFVVVARLVRPGETEDVNTSVAKVNENPRYPQAYYKKKKKKNPYKNAERWFYSGN